MSELKGACIIGQSGGPTSVINASAYGVIRTALDSGCITNVYGAEHGIKGVLEDRLFDMVGCYTAGVHEHAVVVVACDHAVGESLGSVGLGSGVVNLCQTSGHAKHERVGKLLQLGNVTVVEELLLAERCYA